MYGDMAHWYALETGLPEVNISTTITNHVSRAYCGRVGLVLRNLFIGHQLGLIHLVLMCTDGQDCFLNTDRFLVYWLLMPFLTSFSSCVRYLFPLSFHFITHNFCHGHTCLDLFVCVDCYCYIGLLLTSCEISLLRKM